MMEHLSDFSFACMLVNDLAVHDPPYIHITDELATVHWNYQIIIFRGLPS